MRSNLSSALTLALAVGVTGMACDGGGAPDGLRLRTAAQSASCATPGRENGDGEFPPETNRVTVRIAGDALERTIVRSFELGSLDPAGQLRIEDVPPGEGLTLDGVGCDEESATWVGVTSGIDVAIDEATEAPLFLTPVEQMACVGRNEEPSQGPPESGRMSTGHAFSAVAARGDRAWIFGGFGEYAKNTTTLTATEAIDRYDRPTGTFAGGDGEPAATLAAPRAMAMAQPMDDGTIRILGGTTAIQLQQPQSRPPLWPGPEAVPAPGETPGAVERFDPESGESSVGREAGLPAMPAMAVLPDGIALAVGGVTANGGVSDQAVVIPASSDRSVETLTLPGPRYGATVIPASNRQALVWGGNAEMPDEAGTMPADRVALWIDLGADGEERVTVLEGAPASGVPMFASGAHLGGGSDGNAQSFLVAGGTDVEVEGGQAGFTDDARTPRLTRVTVSPGEGSYEAVSVLPQEDQALFQRAAATLYPAPGGRWWLLGGFTSFSTNQAVCPESPDPCLRNDTAGFQLQDGDQPVAVEAPPPLNVGPLGSRVVDLGDGSWLLPGGVRTVNPGDRRAIDPYAGIYRSGVGSERAELCTRPDEPDS